MPPAVFSERGAKAADGVARKQAASIEERVIDQINLAFTNASRKIFEFNVAGKPSDILQAIMPDAKFTKYLFDRNHKNGGSKAVFLIDELGIDPEDWRYLAAQFYFGLLMADPDRVKLGVGYGLWRPLRRADARSQSGGEDGGHRDGVEHEPRCTPFSLNGLSWPA